MKPRCPFSIFSIGPDSELCWLAPSEADALFGHALDAIFEDLVKEDYVEANAWYFDKGYNKFADHLVPGFITEFIEQFD